MQIRWKLLRLHQFLKHKVLGRQILEGFQGTLTIMQINLDEKTLDSDFRKREDLQLLKQGKMEEAQKAKEVIEEKQRKDVKLREKLGPKQ